MKTFLVFLATLIPVACATNTAPQIHQDHRAAEVETFISVPQSELRDAMTHFCGESSYKIEKIDIRFPAAYVGSDGVPHVTTHAYIRFECSSF